MEDLHPISMIHYYLLPLFCLFSGYSTTDMPNYDSILTQYGVSIESGVVLEGDSSHYVSGNPLYLVPEIQSCDATGSLADANSYVLMPVGQSITTREDKSDDITVTDMLTSTSSSYLKAAHEKGNKVAVVLNNDSAVVMEDWIDDVDAILEMYYPGQRGGVATAKLLTGEVNPSGKLAYTIPKKDTDTLITISDEAWNRFEKEDETEDTEKQSDVATQEAGGGFPGGGFPGGGFPGGGFPGGGFQIGRAHV